MSTPGGLLTDIQGRADAATPGPWDVSDANEGMYEYGPMWMVTNDEFHNPTSDEDAPWLAVEMHVGVKEDAEFIAAARDDVPKLVAALQAVLGIVESQPHRDNDEDCWYTCPQARNEDGEWATCNDGAAGGPCDCGRDHLIKLVRTAIAEALGGAP